MPTRLIRCAFLLSGCFCLGADSPSPSPVDEKAAVAVWNGLVGTWKGTGQPVRGSSKGSWSEVVSVRWSFKDNHAHVFMENADGKYFQNAELRPGPKENEFELTVVRPNEKTPIKFRGVRDPGGKMTLSSEGVAADEPARLTLQIVAAGDRMTMLWEKSTGEGRFARLAEVGFTRQGSEFGKGSGGPECIVTGGQGTIAVEHRGQTYFVCCSGCRDAFKENPEKILAEYQERLSKLPKAEGK